MDDELSKILKKIDKSIFYHLELTLTPHEVDKLDDYICDLSINNRAMALDYEILERKYNEVLEKLNNL